MSMNPRETTEKIKRDYQDYIASILSVKDKEITNLAHRAVKNAEFIKGPYLETTLPFVEGHTLRYLAENEHLISTEFGKMGSVIHYDDWKLRIHQENALRQIIERDRNMVVSTGTGSGKTECYLYPIFDALMKEKEAGTLDSGVRALLIFPMNALANDQQKKLRKLLKFYPDITFGRYTGETAHRGIKETSDEAELRLHQEYDLNHAQDTDEFMRKSIPNEMMCREKMAEKPPHILLTNYAMLEYMLLRPDTAPFFDNATAKNWKFIVIDEAHTYKGANGTEIALLLRRVKERIRHNMTQPFRCIATSATLGSDDAKAGLATFAENLFGEPFDESDIITTKRKLREKVSGSREYSPEEYIELKNKVSMRPEEEKGRFLYDALLRDLRLFKIYEVLKSRPKKIEDVSSNVFPDIKLEKERESALINLIELAAAAKKSENDTALLPARYHLFVKSLEGMFAQFYPRKTIYLDRKEKAVEGNQTYSVFELANCQKCGQEYLVGKTKAFEGGSYFVQTSNNDSPEFYFISNSDIVMFDGFDEDDAIEEVDKMRELEKFHLCLCCGKITPYAAKHPADCCANSDVKKIVTVYNLRYSGKDGESNCCPCCGATRKGLIKRFLTANQPATFAVAKSLYDSIPARPLKPIRTDDIFEEDIFEEDIFDDESCDNVNLENTVSKVMDESGRKLLIFSDNRQEAAFFAGFFEKKYSLIMWRRVILKVLKNSEKGSLCVSDLIGRVTIEADKSGLYSFDQERNADMTDDQKLKMAAHYIMQEFISPDIQTGLEGLGYIEVSPEFQKLNESKEIAGLKGENLWNLLRYMMDTLRQKGVVNYPEKIRATDDFFAPRNNVRYFRQQGSKIERGGYTYGFVPQDNTPNKRLNMMIKLLAKSGMSEEEKEIEARKNLVEIYNALLMFKKKNYIVETTDSSNGIVYCLNYAKWEFKYNSGNKKLYKCNKCGKVYSYSINYLCPEMRCDGRLVEIEAKEVQQAPYYSKLFSDDKIIPMVAREHTAQLSSKTAGKYQKDFEDGKINVLSCSTTFEMGVDVGELEATFQRNVPPETSNYIQRAGRAGRRTSSAAFSVTFSRRSSHDMTFYQEPTKIISGKIKVPVLEINNEKIAERHLNSIVVAWFFKKYPEYFTENAKRIVSYNLDENMSTVLRKCLLEKPKELLDSIHLALPDKVCEALNVDEWAFIDDITGNEGSLTRAINERSADIAGLKKFSADVKDDIGGENITKKLSRAMAAEKLVTTLEAEPSIKFLSSKGVLPKYGFPIDTVSLDIISGNNEEAKKIDLFRDLKMAISEFAPPAQIVANGKVWKSYAINTIPDKSWPTYIYYECPKCKKIYPPEGGMVDITVDLEDESRRECNCGTLMNPKKFIIPLFGFSTQMGDEPKPVGDKRPTTYYATQTQFWGIDSLTEKQKSEAREKTIDLKGKMLKITYSPGGKLFVLNQGNAGRGIRVCPTCGFATEAGKILKNGKHETKFKRVCPTRNLVTVSLGHHFSTDIIKIQLPLHKVEMKMPEGTISKNQYASTLYAILEGASSVLDINRDDISGCVSGNGDLILYDDTAGGSGFVKHIYENIEKVLREAKYKVSGLCGCTEETSCYGCLRNYSNQIFHDELSRGLAYHYLDWLLSMDNNIDDNYVSKTSYCIDTIGKIEMLMEASDDDRIKIAYKKLLQSAMGKVLETPADNDKCIRVDENIWPEIFWDKSQVALFAQSSIEQYNILKKYNWHCFILDENIDADLVISYLHVKNTNTD